MISSPPFNLAQILWSSQVLASLFPVGYQTLGLLSHIPSSPSLFDRSKGGIYHTIECQEIGLPTAELLFDLRFFEMEPGPIPSFFFLSSILSLSPYPEPFYKYAKNLLPSQTTLPSLSHHFISYLESQNKLLRNYTQNFDGLEAVAGVTKYLQSHGTIQKFKCLKCRKKVELDAIRQEIEKGLVPYCDCGGVLVCSPL
jgi:NAD-dependent SIR2 family protein deacetylase